MLPLLLREVEEGDHVLGRVAELGPGQVVQLLGRDMTVTGQLILHKPPNGGPHLQGRAVRVLWVPQGQGSTCTKADSTCRTTPWLLHLRYSAVHIRYSAVYLWYSAAHLRYSLVHEYIYGTVQYL